MLRGLAAMQTATGHMPLAVVHWVQTCVSFFSKNTRKLCDAK